jgi:hypothetical protein
MKVLDPTNEMKTTGVVLSPRLASLEGLTIGIITNAKEGTKGYFTHLERMLREDRLWTELNKMGLPVICIAGIARIMQCGAGTRRCASKISTVMRSRLFSSAERCSLRRWSGPPPLHLGGPHNASLHRAKWDLDAMLQAIFAPWRQGVPCCDNNGSGQCGPSASALLAHCCHRHPSQCWHRRVVPRHTCPDRCAIGSSSHLRIDTHECLQPRHGGPPMTTRDIALQMLAARAMDTDDVKLMRLMRSRCAVALRGQRDKARSNQLRVPANINFGRSSDDCMVCLRTTLPRCA